MPLPAVEAGRRPQRLQTEESLERNRLAAWRGIDSTASPNDRAPDLAVSGLIIDGPRSTSSPIEEPDNGQSVLPRFDEDAILPPHRRRAPITHQWMEINDGRF